MHHPGQVVMTTAQIIWTQCTASAISLTILKSTSLRDWHAKQVEQVRDLTAIVRQPISRLERRVIVALVTTDGAGVPPSHEPAAVGARPAARTVGAATSRASRAPSGGASACPPPTGC